MSEWTAETADWYATNYGEYATNRLAVDAIEVARVLRPDGRLVVVKDGGLPGGARATRAWHAAVRRVGLVVREERRLAEGDVACTLWVCGAG